MNETNKIRVEDLDCVLGDQYDRLSEMVSYIDHASEQWVNANEQILEVVRLKQQHAKNCLEAEAAERREETQLKVEKEKVSWKRIGFEIFKIVLPALLTKWIYDRNCDKILEYEKDGIIRSKPGREFRLPNLFKF